MAIRGPVRILLCDQGSNFVGAKNEFRKAFKEMDQQRVTDYLLNRQCDFKFNAPLASHTGGVWERQIRTVRSVLNATVALCPGRLDDSSLRTVLYECMYIVNTRPIVVSPDDPENTPLTPNHVINEVPLRWWRETLFPGSPWSRRHEIGGRGHARSRHMRQFGM